MLEAQHQNAILYVYAEKYLGEGRGSQLTEEPIGPMVVPFWDYLVGF